MNKSTSWEEVASWYDEFMEDADDTYQRQVILPNLLRILSLRKNESLLDLACGQGFFAREFHAKEARVVGVDISPELIRLARTRSPKEITYHISSADALLFLAAGSFDIVCITLALQNIENVSGVFAECHRVLKPSGRLVLVINHPAFRVLKHSSWDWDGEKKVQYRRVDSYLSEAKVSVTMHPGEKKSPSTISFHRPLQYYFKMLSKHGFAVSRLEEWISHRRSEKGLRKEAEDKARKEIPLFLAIEGRVRETGWEIKTLL